MKTTNPKEAAATQPVSTVAINASVSVRDSSIGQVIEQALADTTKPSPEQSLIESTVMQPGVGTRADLQVEDVVSSAGGGEDGEDGEANLGFSLGNLATSAAAMRDSLTDLTNDPAKQDPYDLSVGGSRPSQEELEEQLGLGAVGQETDTGGSASDDPDTSTGTGGNPNSTGTGGQSSQNQPPERHENPLAGMFEDGQGNGVNRTYTKDGHEFVNWKTKTDTSSDGTVTSTKWADGTTVVENKENGTTTTLNPDGSSSTTTTTTDENGNTTTTTDTTPAPKCPDEDHAPLPEEITAQIEAELAGVYRPSHDNDEITPDDTDSGGMFSGAIVNKPVDLQDKLLGGDSMDGLGDIAGEHGPGNVPAQEGGDIDYGPDHDQAPQTSGPEERDTSHEIEHGAPGSEDTRGRQGSGQDSSPTKTTPAQEAAQQLKDAYKQNHDDPDRDKPIFEPHEKLPGPDIGQGPGAHLDAVNAFADLIRAAQKPAELGLMATQPALPGADAMLQLAAKADFAGQDFGPHGIEDLGAAAGTPPSVADSPVEHHAPMLEHFQIGHH